MPECLRYEKVKKTRKAHICFACLGKIETGSAAYKWVSVDGGEITSVYLHEKCGQIVEGICFNCRDCGDFNGYQEGFLKESISSGYECNGAAAFNAEYVKE